MPLKFTCPNCLATLSAPDEFAGRKAKCHKCNFVILIPGEKPHDLDSRIPIAISKGAILEAIDSPIQPVPSTPAYKVALLAVAVVMLLLPLLYFGLILGMGWGTWSYALYGFEFIKNNPPQGREGTARVIFFVAPVIAGVVSMLFMVKPFFARPSKGSKPISLDPKQEPILFAYVEKLCKSVHAPVPKRIDIDSNVNASASLRGGWLSLLRSNDLVLTIGMPLVSGLTLREFSGVLAHEFGHFSQGLGMRLTYIVRSINFWFGRVVYERDAWDQRLRRWANVFDFRVGFVLHFARLLVWLTRCVLWVFMMFGHSISCLLLRQMEFDADLHEIRLSGSKAFAATFRQVRRLTAANQQVLGELEEFLLNGKLVDDIPKLVGIRRDSLDEESIALLSKMESEEKGHWLDTHPVDRQRIAVAENLAIEGKIRLETPAQTLFRQYEQHCKQVTRVFYQESLGEKFDERMLADVSQLITFQEASKEASKASERFFGLNFKLPRMINPLPVASRGLSQDEALRQLESSRQSMIAGLPAYDESSKSFEKLDSRWIESKQALSILRAGFLLDSKAWKNFESCTLDAITGTEQAVRTKLGGLHVELANFEQHFQNRVDAAIQWLHATPQTSLPIQAVEALGAAEKITQCLNVQNQTYRSVVDLRSEIAALMALIGLISGKDATQTQVDEFERSCGRVLNSIKSIRHQSTGVLYPYEHSDGEIDLANYLTSIMPKEDDKPAILETATRCLQHFHYAYFRNIGELAVVIEQVESVLGWPLQNTPEKIVDVKVVDSDEIVTAKQTRVKTTNEEKSYVRKLLLLGYLGCLLPITLVGIAFVISFLPLIWKWEGGGGRNASRTVDASSSSFDGTVLNPAATTPDIRNHSIHRLFQYRIPTGSPVEYRIKIVDAADAEEIHLEGTCSIRSLNSSVSNSEETMYGTGFAISSEGLFATSAQVVANSAQIQVISKNQRAIAKVIAIDWEKDLAILRADSLKLNPLPLSNSQLSESAQDVLVVGFPLAEEKGSGVDVTTLTVAGIVNRDPLNELISLDASINPGITGGPVFNQKGEVIGVASMKRSNRGSMESVGCASPVRQLKDLVDFKKLSLKGVDTTHSKTVRSQDELSAAVTPSVVVILAQGRSAGNFQNMSFQSIYEQKIPSFGSTQVVKTTGTMKVSPNGRVLSIEKAGFLPFALGSLPELILQQLDTTLQSEWSLKRNSIWKRPQPNVGSGRATQRLGQSQSNDVVAGSLPSVEEITFKLIKEENGWLYFDRKHTFQTLDDESNPTLKIEGTGTWVFDLNDGLSQSMDQTLQVTEKGVNANSIRIQYHRRSQAELAEQTKQNDAAIAAQKEQERIKREVPNPEAVKELLAGLRNAGFKGGSWSILKELASVAVVEELRQDAIVLLRQYAFPERKRSFMGESIPNSVEAFIHWADETCEAEILDLIKKGGAERNVRQVLAYLGRLKKLEHAPMLIAYLQDPFVASDASAAILSYDDPSIEDLLLTQCEKSNDTRELRAIIGLLGGKFGTEKSISVLEAIGRKDPFTKVQCSEAIRKIKARK